MDAQDRLIKISFIKADAHQLRNADVDKIYKLMKTAFKAQADPVAKSPAAMAGSAANAATLKMKISGILMDAICGDKEKYRTPEGFIRWGVVEGDMNETIDAALR